MKCDYPSLLLAGVLTVGLAGCQSETEKNDANKPVAGSSNAAAKTDSQGADAVQSPTTSAATNADKSTSLDAHAARGESETSESTPPAEGSESAATDSSKVLLGSPDLTAGIPGDGPLTVTDIQAWLDRSENHQSLEVELPLGLNAGKIPDGVLEENPLTRAKIELGRQLYFDTRLSADNTISCASCHHPDDGYARHTQFGVGIGGQQGGRNSPVSYNRILSTLQFWDGRAGSLEEQAIGPIANPIEMGNTHDAAVATLQGIEGYRLQFERIFGESGVTIENVGKAIAAFERVIVTSPAPFDYYEQLKPYLQFTEEDFKDDAELKQEYELRLAGAASHPMSESAIRGRDLFFSERGTCATCHVGANLADEKYHNLGIGMNAEKPDLGRYEVTKEEKDRGAFKTPSIRNVALTAPYMHDGSLKTLLEVVEHYNKGGIANPQLSDKMKKLELSPQDKEDLVAFMEACTGEYPPIRSDRLPE